MERGWAISKVGSGTVPLMNSRRVRYSDSSCQGKVQKNGYQVQITVHVPYDPCFLDMRDKIFLLKCGDFISKAAACNSFLSFFFFFNKARLSDMFSDSFSNVMALKKRSILVRNFCKAGIF